MSLQNLSNPLPPRPWWQRSWGIILILFLVMLAVGVLWFGLAVYQNVRDIKSGRLTQLNSFAAFTADKTATSTVAAKSAPLVRDNNSSFGNPQAKLQIVMFGDFECPFTRDAFPVVRQLMKDYGNRVYFVWRDYPLINDHPQAMEAAVAARCAGVQGKFWEFFDVLFVNQNDLSATALQKYAGQVGLDKDLFISCLKSSASRKEVQQDMADGVKFGVKGTPTFFVNGYKMEGVPPVDAWAEIINRFAK